MDINTLKSKIEYFSYMAKNWKDEDVVVIEKDVVLELLNQVKNNDLLHSVSGCFTADVVKESYNDGYEDSKLGFKDFKIGNYS